MKKILSIISAGVLALFASSCVQEELRTFDPSNATAPVLQSYTLDENGITASYTPGAFNMGFNSKVPVNHTLVLATADGKTVGKTVSATDDGSTLVASASTISKLLTGLGYEEGASVSLDLFIRAMMQGTVDNGSGNGSIDSEGHITGSFVVTVPKGNPWKDYTETSPWGVTGAIAALGINWDKDIAMFMTEDGTKHVARGVKLAASDQFKFRKDGGWTDNFGGEGDVEPFVVSLGTEYPAAAGGKNLAVPTDGVYDLMLDTQNNTFTVTEAFLTYPGYDEASAWSVIGSIASFEMNWDKDIAMITDGTWHVAEGVVLKASDQFKFRKDQAWTDNFGAEGDVEPFVVDLDTEYPAAAGGKNLAVSADGTYDLLVNPDGKLFKVVESLGGKSGLIGGDEPEPEPEPVKGWNIIGLNGDWENDIIAAQDGDVWTVYITAEGDTEFKWRKDGGWDENYGGVMTALGEPFEAVAGGDNIKVSAGFYRVDLDTEALTITVSEGNVWSLIGDFNSWGGDVDMTLSDGKWIASDVALSGGWKLRKNHGWDDNRGGVFAAFDGPFEAVAGGDNIDCGEGKFNVVYDPESETITISNAAKVWGVIGDFNGWGGDVAMAEVMPGIWVSDPITTEGGWKIRFDAGWDVNRGGALTKQGEFAKAVPGGDNITLAGTFKVVYNANNETIGTLGWGVTGSIASAGINWDKDIPMNLGSDGKWYSVPFTATAADQFKIRYNAGWDENFGGTFAAVDEAFEAVAGGDNISVAEDGTYMLVYDPEAATLTVTKDFWGLIGGFNSWGGDVFMICQGAGVWAAYGQTLGAEWKIRQACGWDVNRGGDFVAMGEPFEAVAGGNNISAGDGVIDIVYNAADETITVSE